MRQRGMLIAVGLVLLVNAVVLVGVAANRSGEPDAVVTLTERELPLSSYDGYAERENTGLSLRLSWVQGRTGSVRAAFPPARRRGRPAWFDKAKLEAIGFDCAMPLDDPSAALHYDKMLPRKTFVVLEYEGAAWESWLEEGREELAGMEEQIVKGEVSPKQRKDAGKEFEREARTCSRLFAVDVGNDPAALRERYGDRGRFLILPSTVRLLYTRPDDAADERRSPPYLEGSIADVLTDEIFVPKEHRAVLEKLLHADGRMNNGEYSAYAHRNRGPLYAVTVHVGKRHEPWVEDVRGLGAGAVK